MKLPKKQKKPSHHRYLQNCTLISQSTPIPLAMNVVIVLFLVNALLVHAPGRRRRGSRDRRRRQHFRQALELFALPLDFADALAALAADVLGQFDEAEDVFLLRRSVLFFKISLEGFQANLRSGGTRSRRRILPSPRTRSPFPRLLL